MNDPKTQPQLSLENLEEAPKPAQKQKPQEGTGGKVGGQKCNKPGCQKDIRARGLCAVHYNSHRISLMGSGDWEVLKTPRVPSKACSVDGCERKAIAKGLCQTHRKYQRKGAALSKIPESRMGENNPKWRGGEVLRKDGRTLIYRPDHPYPNFCKIYVYRYRLVVEESLGRYLLPAEIVHHINGDPSDDRIENLSVMSQADHMRAHLPEMMAKQGKRYGTNN